MNRYMDLHILSLSQACSHEPKKPTYAIRIFNSDWEYFGLKKSDLYIGIDDYHFDDNEIHGPLAWPVSINEDIAETILKKFVEYRGKIESLLVHCTRWKNRSPSVVMALNDVFWLWHDTQEIKKAFPDYNRLVYNILQKAGEKYKPIL
jgi:hypothetical protein